ncbi:hypothetical protein N7457_002486 [Penicillium paradoxum]|uniref:uncharacterized protein n=1 Tax=Penicillium paradoxum TaxID=176176 RepID=UPI00254940F8|nr:uncharacterized protein N7457_002486 [Penicillium paradoxum]KAJ5787496.1 hypothetical protein N7457_002486 [Penicillium paradoxum]
MQQANNVAMETPDITLIQRTWKQINMQVGEKGYLYSKAANLDESHFKVPWTCSYFYWMSGF